MQESFSRLWDGYKTDKEAIKARNARAKELRARGFHVKCWRLADQLKKYDGFGIPNGGTCHVYYVDYQLDSASPSNPMFQR